MKIINTKPGTLALSMMAVFASVLAVGAPAGASILSAPGPLCTATASPKHPHQHTTVDIAVNGNKAGAKIHTVAHYKTTSNAKSATANKYGNATIPYEIANASIGYTVRVDATVTAGGHTGSCSTSFTPEK